MQGKGSFRGLFYKDTDPIREDSNLTTYHLPKAPIPNAITLGLGSQHLNGGGTNIQSTALMCFCQFWANSLPYELG